MLRFIVIASLVALAVAGGGKEYQEMKMWSKIKAMESCLGEENVHMWMIKHKKAAAKCSGIDAPELELPMFKNPFKIVSALTSQSGSSDGPNFEKIMEKYLQMQMFRQFTGGEASPRFRRAADDDEVEDVFDLGERLNAKLMMKKEQMEDKMGNWTCFLRECGLFDENNKFSTEKKKEHLKKMELDSWLKEKLIEGCDMCTSIANSLPQDVLDKCTWGPEMLKVKMFKKCMYKMKFHACMNHDLKQKIEKNFGPVDKLVEQTGLEEKMLYEVVKSLMKGPEQEFM